jgi:hypothetical protein
MGNSSFTTEEIVKITIAVMGIFILLVFSVSLVGIFLQNSELEQAKATMKEMRDLSTNLAEDTRQQMLLNVPRNWGLISYGERICMCPLLDNYETNFEEVQKEICTEEGYCEDNDLKYLISGRDTICTKTLNGQKNVILDCISLEYVPRALIIENNSGNVLLQITYISKPEDIEQISGVYKINGEDFPSTFGITYTQYGDRRLTNLNLYPLFQVKENAKISSPSIFLDKKDENWLELKVFYNDEYDTPETTEGTWWVPQDQRMEVGFVSLTDGSIWISNAMITSFFLPETGKVFSTEEKYKKSYKTNIFLDLETLKTIQKTL